MEITVCIGSSCHLKGAPGVVEQLQRLIEAHELAESVVLRGSFCLNRCQSGVCVVVDGKAYSLTPESTERFFLQTVLPQCGETRYAHA